MCSSQACSPWVGQMCAPWKPHCNQDVERQEDLKLMPVPFSWKIVAGSIALGHPTSAGKYQCLVRPLQSWGKLVCQPSQAFNILNSPAPSQISELDCCFFGWVYRWLLGPRVDWWSGSKEKVISGVLWVHPCSPLNYLVGWELECVFWPFPGAPYRMGELIFPGKQSHRPKERAGEEHRHLKKNQRERKTYWKKKNY